MAKTIDKHEHNGQLWVGYLTCKGPRANPEYLLRSPRKNILAHAQENLGY